MWDDGTFICAFCGSRNFIETDPSGGLEQVYIEDCQVCCRPNQLRVIFDRETLEASVSSEMEEE
jgi:hypothetical protein